MTLPEFLLARIADDEVFAGRMLSRTRRGEAPPNDLDRVQTDLDARRRIACRLIVGGLGEWERATLEWVCRQLALPYADHPDYQQKWRP